MSRGSVAGVLADSVEDGGNEGRGEPAVGVVGPSSRPWKDLALADDLLVAVTRGSGSHRLHLLEPGSSGGAFGWVETQNVELPAVSEEPV